MFYNVTKIDGKNKEEQYLLDSTIDFLNFNLDTIDPEILKPRLNPLKIVYSNGNDTTTILMNLIEAMIYKTHGNTSLIEKCNQLALRLIDIRKDLVGVVCYDGWNNNPTTPLMMTLYGGGEKRTLAGVFHDLTLALIDTGISKPEMEDVDGHNALVGACELKWTQVVHKLLHILPDESVGDCLNSLKKEDDIKFLTDILDRKHLYRVLKSRNEKVEKTKTGEHAKALEDGTPFNFAGNEDMLGPLGSKIKSYLGRPKGGNKKTRKYTKKEYKQMMKND
jgi:hypothetical protein